MTLVELLVAIVMMSIVIAALYNLFRVHNLMAAKQEETTLMQQELLSVMVQMADELRMCGYAPDGGTFGFNGTGTTNTSVFCTKDTLNPNGVVDNDDNATEYAGYRINVESDGTPQASPKNELYEYVPYTNGTIAWEVVATNIGDLQFTYLDSNGDTIANPATNADSIRTVQITATAVPSARRSELGIGNRTMTTSVLCRNIGL